MSTHWLFCATANTAEFEALIAVQAPCPMHVIASARGAAVNATDAAATVEATAATTSHARERRPLRDAVLNPIIGSSLVSLGGRSAADEALLWALQGRPPGLYRAEPRVCAGRLQDVIYRHDELGGMVSSGQGERRP